MTRKHYIEVAEMIASMKKENKEIRRNQRMKDCNTVIAEIAIRLADMFERDNELFNRAKFYTACGL